MAEVSLIERIVSKVKTYFAQIAHYDEEYAYTDFIDDDIPNVRAVNQLIDIAISGSVLPGTPITYNMGDPIPTITNFQVDYAQYGAYPDIIVFYTDTGIEIKTATITRTPLESPTSIKVDAANDGTDHLDGNITIVIKQ